jgi:putative PEP-CTERM system TPR-repeat lipoprotein
MKYNNKLALTICVAFSLIACSPKKTAEEYIQSAKTQIANGKSSSAVLELKNAILIDLENPESRLLLGALYLELGDVEAAEKELTRALELNGNGEHILPKLFKSLHLQSESEKIITLSNQNNIIPESILPEILLYKTLAYISIGDKGKAEETIAQASEVSSGSVYSQLGEAYLMAGSTGANGALSLVDNILIKTPEFSEALILKGQLHFSQGNYKNAIDTFNEYHRLLPNNVRIRLFLANSYVRNEQYSEADKHLNFLLEIVPEHPFTNQLKGVVLYQQGDYENALAHTDKAIQNGLNVPSNRIIAGLSAFKLEQYERSHHFLITATEFLPSSHPVRKVLAAVQLQLGYSSEAGDVLQVMEGATADDINLLTTASFALLKSGKFQEAKALVNKTSGISTSDPQDIAKIGLLKLSMNDLEGITDLEKAFEIDPDLPIAKFSLASAYIQNEEYDKALDLAEKWKASYPEKVEGYNLAAKIWIIKNQTDIAEQELNKVLSFDIHNPYARLYFANKFLLNKQPEKAVIQLENIFSTIPEHLDALKLNYRVHKALKTEGEAILKIKQSFINNPKNQSYSLLYARVLFIEKKFSEVIELLVNTDSRKNISSIHWALIGDSYFKLNNHEKALVIYDEWIENQPTNRTAWLRKVSAQEKLTDYYGALLTVEQLLLKVPDDGQFKVLRANYLILTKKFSEAQKQIDDLTVEQKQLPLVKGLQGQIWLTESKFEQAITGLEGLYSLLPNPYNTAMLFATHKKLGQEQIAFDFIIKHVESYPEDTISRTLLAEHAITFNLELAKKHFLVLLKSSPDSLSILNNLAWSDYKLGNYVEANRLIEQALELDSPHPQVLDTAGLIQIKLGNKSKAIELLNRAKLLAPNDTEIANHYREAVAQ